MTKADEQTDAPKPDLRCFLHLIAAALRVILVLLHLSQWQVGIGHTDGVSKMDPIRLIRDKTELHGTCYFEFLPGEYKEQCWSNESVFLAEDVFGLIEPIVARHEPRFDHYSFVGIRRHAWERIIADLERLAERAERASGTGDLAGEVWFVFTPTEAEFAREFRANADALARLVRELVGWVREQLWEQECISVLGI